MTAIVSGGLSLVLFAAAGAWGGRSSGWFYVAITVVFAVVVPATVSFLILRRQDLPNALRRVVLPFMAILQEEVAGAAPVPVVLRLDLRGAEAPGKETTLARPTSASDRYFTDRWMVGEAGLADGSRLAWSVEDRVRKRTVRRRGRRGRWKTKIKYKTKTVVRVELGLRRKDYAVSSAPARPAGNERLVVKSGDKRHVIRLQSVLAMGTVITAESVVRVRNLVDLVAKAYALASPLRAPWRAS